MSPIEGVFVLLSAQENSALTSVCSDTAGAEQTKQKADCKSHSQGSRTAGSAGLRHLPGLDLCSGADSGEQRGNRRLFVGFEAECSHQSVSPFSKGCGQSLKCEALTMGPEADSGKIHVQGTPSQEASTPPRELKASWHSLGWRPTFQPSGR